MNCKNADGLTPLLLVTRDLNLFEKSKTIVLNVLDGKLCYGKRLIFIFLLRFHVLHVHLHVPAKNLYSVVTYSVRQNGM